MSLFKTPIQKLRKRPTNERGEVAFGRFTVEYTNPLSLYYEHKDIFESRIYHFTARGPAPVILDAGGCIGMSALYFKSVYPDARVTCFEPDPALLPLLRRNLERNGFPDVTVVNVGLGKTEGTLDFFPDGSDGGSMYQVAGAKPIQVKIARLSDFITGPVDFLKMNIEGMEGDVFEEIEAKLPQVRELVFEYHCFHDLPQSLGKILQILDRQGFRYVVTDATNAKVPVPLGLPERYRYFNLVYARRG